MEYTKEKLIDEENDDMEHLKIILKYLKNYFGIEEQDALAMIDRELERKK